MWDFLKTNSNLISVFAGGLSTYLFEQTVSYLRREKYRLGYSVKSRTIAESCYPSLMVKYNDHDIKRLDSHIIKFCNIGNRSLLQLPITIDTYDGEIVAHEAGFPDGTAYTCVPKDNVRLVVTVDLVKPNEIFSIGLTVVNAKENRVKIVARGENLDIKEIDENSTIDELIDILSPRKLP